MLTCGWIRLLARVGLGAALTLAGLNAQFQKFEKFPAATCGVKCGTERWIVKALADQDADKVDLTPEETTITALRKPARPKTLPIDGRFEPVEVKTYTVKAVILAFKHEDDGDFHVVIAEPGNHKTTMIAEVVDPSCRRVCQSKQVAKMKAVRAKFIQKFGEGGGSSFEDVNPPVAATITGVGFFDFRHGQRGLAPNAIELHPILDIEFNR